MNPPSSARPHLSAAIGLLLACPTGPAPAGTADQAVELDKVKVTAPRARDRQQARATLDRVPGGTGLVDMDRLEAGRLSGIAQVLALQPGVHAQSPGNEGVKISIRGSGISRAPGAHASGVTVMLDGLPLTEPGGTPYELLEPLWSSRVEILRGANGLERGALALGGAINHVTRSGKDSPGLELRYEAGSHGYRKRSLGHGGESGSLDYFLAYADVEYDGYRRHAASDGKGMVANLGWRLSPDLETRFHLRYRETFHLTPGRLTRQQIRHDPRAANPANLGIDARRPQPGSTWLSNTTTLRLDGDSTLSAGLAYHDYPMDLQESLYRQRIDYTSLNGTLDYQRSHRLWGRASQTRVGLQFAHDLPGNRSRETLRIAGNGHPAGTHTRDYVHRGSNRQLHVANALSLAPGLRLHSALALIHGTRKAWVSWPAGAERVTSEQWDYAPRLGLDWQATPGVQLFGNLSRSVEPPHAWSMLWGSNQYFGADAGPAAGRQRAAVALDNQTATTLEIGGRGDAPIGRWQLSLYQSEVRHELLSVEIAPAPNAFVAESNASPTVHRGVELGLDSRLWQGAAGTLSLRQAHTFSDFRYRHDARFGRNRLPGLPRLYSQAGLHYAHPSGFSAGLNTEYASRMPVDHANSYHADARVTFGANLGYAAPGGRWRAWLDLRNLGDRRYAATVTPGYDDAGQDLARSTPGEGFAVHAGVAYWFGQ